MLGKNTLLIALSIVIAGAIIGIAIVSNNNVPEKISSKESITSNSYESEDFIVDIDDDAVKGLDSAPVTIIEFSDYQCPFCARFYSETLSKIDEKYIQTGKVKMVYRDFPLAFHEYAQKSAEAAECSGEQGKFWEYHDLLFENQAEWSQQGISKFKEYAELLRLDRNRFDKCLDEGEMAEEVKKDLADGTKAGVEGTPAFFINGKFVSGAQPFSVFEEIIEEELCDDDQEACSIDL